MRIVPRGMPMCVATCVAAVPRVLRWVAGWMLGWVGVHLHLLGLRLRLLRVHEGRTGLRGWLSIQLEVTRLLQLERSHLVAELAPLPRIGAPAKPAEMAMALAAPVIRDIVLVGGGHSHVHVLKAFAMRPQPGVQLTLITRDVDTPYSGMLPAYCAGRYSWREAHIDLVRLAGFAKARLVHAEACGLDTAARRVLLRGRPPVAYDVVSIDIGSAPRTLPVLDEPEDAEAAATRGRAARAREAAVAGGGQPSVTPVKPIDGFCRRWDRIVERVRARAGSVRLVVVGAGAGGIELTLAMQSRLLAELRALGRPPSDLSVTVVSRSEQVLPQHSTGVRRSFSRILHERGIRVVLGAEVSSVTRTELRCKGDVPTIPYDEAVWCTQGAAQEWLRETGLELDAAGFVAVRPTLQSTSHDDVFAAGDVAAVLEHPRPKAGVFAVRQGPPLADNLRRAVLGLRPRPFAPQSTFLGLIATGDGGCVGSRGLMALEGAWLWELKDWIDRNWMRGYTELKMRTPWLPALRLGAPDRPPPVPDVARTAGADALDALAHASMRCGGCGSKVGAPTLSRVMARLAADGANLEKREGVLVGLDAPDDCAVLAPSKRASVHTVDFFRSFVSDPYVFGQIAANHALSDAHAMGAEPVGALAVAVVPYGLESKVEETLYQMMSGACDVLAKAGCALVGGHTCEGAELALGFAVTGLASAKGTIHKGGMRAGHAIVLTKPLGTGVIFAGQMRNAAAGAWVGAAVRGMVQSNAPAARCLAKHRASACTDVTGFGLFGHLHEMCAASRARVRVCLDDVALLDGAAELVAQGIFSSLQPANMRLRRAVANEADALRHPAYPLAFDPQTTGGLLAAVPADAVADCVAELREMGYASASAIGEVLEVLPDGACIAAPIECA